MGIGKEDVHPVIVFVMARLEAPVVGTSGSNRGAGFSGPDGAQPGRTARATPRIDRAAAVGQSHDIRGPGNQARFEWFGVLHGSVRTHGPEHPAVVERIGKITGD